MRGLSLFLLLVPLLPADNPPRQRYPKYYSETLPTPAKVAPAQGGLKPSADSLRRAAGLRYWIIYTRRGEQAPRLGDPSHVFSNGDRVKLQLESNIDGYLYIWMKGSSGKEQLLFPDPRIDGGRNEVRSWQKLTVPTRGWFAITDQPGEDVLTIIVSRKPLADDLDRKDEQRTYMAMVSRLPSATRDFEFVTEEEPPAANRAEPKSEKQASYPSERQASYIVVNLNAKENDSVYTTVTIRHK